MKQSLVQNAFTLQKYKQFPIPQAFPEKILFTLVVPPPEKGPTRTNPYRIFFIFFTTVFLAKRRTSIRNNKSQQGID